jgi:hypothetical protein
MNSHLAAVALQFLARVNLTGGEVPAFVAVHEALAKIAQSGQQPQESEAECQRQP